MEEWRLLLSTRKFNVFNLQGDTQQSMNGILRAYNSFRYDDNINASREGTQLASVVIDRPEHENGPSDSLPGRLTLLSL
ncbi:hypothetical protein AU210_000861 [Fusarium oxysporum f. sp. radicis-cucumerinum]|uniref:Uncharacterized protein n=1 Tax=Fusarium oxysporum f. sp. radicis-cucumerinum TaxID=327505 RepID=A0A2H3HT46_FUSOX|nr:hypothetical protein AU210_000861 [Fusarium oxysporum f. sp. radicis-cucumerinum]